MVRERLGQFGAWGRLASIAAATLLLPAAASAADLAPPADGVRPSIWVIELGGYGVLQPDYEGSKRHSFGFKPIGDVYRVGDPVWFSSPNDAWSIDLYSTGKFHTGIATDASLQNRYHGDYVDFRVGKADIALQTGVFAEYFPVESVRIRAEALEFLTGFQGFSLNLSADYIWRPQEQWTLSAGPRLQVVDDRYASDLFSVRAAQSSGKYVAYKAEGGIHAAGTEITGTYDWTQTLSTKFFVDYSRLLGDAADSPRVNVRGSADQVTVGIGASYKFAIDGSQFQFPR